MEDPLHRSIGAPDTPAKASLLRRGLLAGSARVSHAAGFSRFPGRILAYWLTDEIATALVRSEHVELGEPRAGLTTGDSSASSHFWELKTSRQVAPDANGGGFGRWTGREPNTFLGRAERPDAPGRPWKPLPKQGLLRGARQHVAGCQGSLGARLSGRACLHEQRVAIFPRAGVTPRRCLRC